MILTCGLSPAWQHILVADGLSPGEVNRASEVYWCASGKVLNAASAIAHLGGKGRVVSVLGGARGADVQREFEGWEVETSWVDCTAPTRVCTTMIDSSTGSATELVENAGALSASELACFRQACAEGAGEADLILAMGSLPPGVPADIFAEILAATSARAVLDIRGPELLQAVSAGAFLVKPNRQELEWTLGREFADEAAVLEGMRELNERGAEWVVVSQGAGPVLVTSAGVSARALPLPVEVVNSIGCGDCMAGAIALALDEGQEPLAAISYGIAAAADNLTRVLMGRLDRRRVEELAAEVKTEAIPIG